METLKKQQSGSEGDFLEGQVLIAMPDMADERFTRTVIYVCAHSTAGAMGIILNRRASHISFSQLLEQLELLPEDGSIGRTAVIDDLAIHVGGPVETGRGFVLHSADYSAADSTLLIDDEVCLTATIDILRAIATGDGPNLALLALGYAGWGPGQLEGEMQCGGWLTCPADMDLIFSSDVDMKYERALSKLGIDLTHLVSVAGHA